MNKLRGFTILEMVVVIGIIGVIGTAGLSSYSAVQKKARDSRRTTDLELMRAAVEQYRSNTNAYPTTMPFPASGGNTGLCDPAGCSSGKYLESVPTDPIPPQRYVYQYESASDYTVCALLASGGTSSFGDCSSATGTQTCNYCLGPYGKK